MPPKTVVVLGASYGGARAAQIIAAGLPEGWRIVLIDRNSHVNHVYVMPRYAVLAGHEHKAFIPSDNILKVPRDAEHVVLHAQVQSMGLNSIKLSRAFPEHGIDVDTLHFDYAIYALGSHLPSPLNLWHASPNDKPDAPPYTGSKADGIAWLKGKQRAIEDAASVLVVGGGALGIQFASDIAAIFPDKSVTLLHSRSRLLPRFDSAIHSEIVQVLESLNVDLILGERLDLSTTALPGSRTVRTTTGREIKADLVLLCTGQRPNTQLLSALHPHTVDSQTQLAHVLRTMQLGVLSPDQEQNTSLEAAVAQMTVQDGAEEIEEEGDEDEDEEDEEEEEDTETTPFPHIFVVGDAADAFGAIPAGHTAYYQAEVAAHNVLRLIAGSDEPLERYTPGAPAIKVSLGLTKHAYEVNGVVGVGKETHDDLNAQAMWPFFGITVEDEADMYR